MLIVKKALSTQALGCLEKLKSLDLSTVAADLTNPKNGYGWSRKQTLQAIERYKAFLFISYLYPEHLLVPAQDIDRVWHHHILHTRQYRQDCEWLFGRFIDHTPDSGLGSERDRANLDAAFAQTQALLALFEEEFTVTGSGELKLADVQLPPNTIENQQNLHLYRSACGRPACVKNSLRQAPISTLSTLNNGAPFPLIPMPNARRPLFN